MFPKLRRKGSRMNGPNSSRDSKDCRDEELEEEENVDTIASTLEGEEATDYVFRIITTFKPDNLRKWLIY